jgi:hypothetical protein
MEEEGSRARAVESFFVTTAFTLIIVRWNGKRNQGRKHAISVTKLRLRDEGGGGSLSLHSYLECQ